MRVQFSKNEEQGIEWLAHQKELLLDDQVEQVIKELKTLRSNNTEAKILILKFNTNTWLIEK